MKLETFWLYHGKRVLTAVRMPKSTPPRGARARAIQDEKNFPMGSVAGESSLEYQRKLALAKVVTYDENSKPTERVTL